VADRPLGRCAGRTVGQEGDQYEKPGREREGRGRVDLEDEQAADEGAEQHGGDGEAATAYL
jgi:hypothetical protein